MYRCLTLLLLSLVINEAWPQDNAWMSFGPERKHLYCLAIDWHNSNVVYAGGSDGQNAVLYRSTDHGRNWSIYVFKNSAGLTGGLTCLAVDPHNPRILYAGNVFGIYKSTDQGLTWTWTTSRLPGYLGASAIAIDPANPKHVYFCINAQGVYKSMDAGASWTLTDSTNLRGPLWAQAIAIDPVNSSTIYVGTSGNGVFKTTDGAGKWTPLNTGFPPTERDVRALAIDRENPLTIFAGQYTGPFMTSNGGANWEKFSFTTMPVFGLAIDPENPAIIYAGTLGEGVFKSSDRGETWGAINRSLPTLAVDKIVLDPHDPNVLYALTYSGIYQLQQSTNSTSQENVLLRFIASGGDREIEIAWEMRQESNLAGFILLRRAGAAGTFAEIANFNQDSTLVARGTTGRFSRRYLWRDLSVANGATYWYQLKIVTKAGEETVAAPVSAAPSVGNILVQADETLAWEWQNPLPTGNRLWDVDFIDDDHGWIVGEHGTMLCTTNGGRSWKFLSSGLESKNVRGWAGIHFRQVKFFDRNNGVVGGYLNVNVDDIACEQIILRTGDGGETWKVVFRAAAVACSWRDMFFLDSRQGWVFIEAQGTFKTVDGGLSWQKAGGLPPSYGGRIVVALNKLFFTTQDSGWGALDDQTVYQTTDGAKSWVRKIVPTLGATNDIFFLNPQTGWMVDDAGRIFQTRDAGRNWNLQPILGSYYLSRIRFVDHSTGFILAYHFNHPSVGPDQGIIFKTIDGGANWTRQYATPDILFAGFDVVGASSFWAAGYSAFDTQRNFSGLVLRSYNQGETWQPLYRGIPATIHDLQFADLNNGWALAAREDSVRLKSTVLLRTANGGRQWQVQTQLPTLNPRRLVMLDTQQGWALTSGFNTALQNEEWAFYRTLNGWMNWDGTTFTGNQVYDTRFIDAQHGWAGGSKGLLLRTDDGGINWQRGRLLTADSAAIDVERLYFLDARHGWAVGWNGRSSPTYGVFLETLDGGRTWQAALKRENWKINDIVFVDGKRGWATATMNQSFILHTTDGGRNWQTQDTGVADQAWVRIAFADSLLGWALSNDGQLIYTTNAGRVWQKQQRFTDGLLTMTFVDPAHGWIAGKQGKILATVQGGVPFDLCTAVSSPRFAEKARSYQLYQNYPNPFNPSTRIEYDLASNSRVSLKIFNVLGQEVKTLLDNKFETAGRHATVWNGRDHAGNALAAGVYFYRLQAGEFAKTLKLLLMK